MNRNQRKAHALLWPLLAIIGLVVCVAALSAKSETEDALAKASAAETE